MSIYFFINSQSELSLGLPWVERFSRCAGGRVRMVVVSSDGEALLQHTKQSVSGKEFVQNVTRVEANVDDVIDLVRTHTCQHVIMVSDQDNDELQQSIFEKSPLPTIWLRPQGPPPEAANQIFSIDTSAHDEVNAICQSLLGFPAELDLLDPDWHSAPDLDETDQENPTENLSVEKQLARKLHAAERQRCDAGDLICIPYDTTQPGLWKAAIELMINREHTSILLFREGENYSQIAGRYFHRLAAFVAEPLSREDRKELSLSLEQGSQPNVEFLGLISASAMLAAFGLLQDSAAVVIGAMLIAPLMTPILGAGLSMTHGNRPLFRASIRSISLGFFGAITAGMLFGWLVRLTDGISATDEMWARCNPSPLDFCVGLVGGMAASYARTRAHLSSALAGAAIAAALVPPLATVGLQIAFGQWTATPQGVPIIGPLLLVTTNVLTIMIGSSIILYARGLRGDRGQSQADRWGLRMFVMLSTLACLFLVILAN